MKADITHFFDSIDWVILQKRLSRTIQEEDVLELIHMNACTASLDEVSGEICEKKKGIHVGEEGKEFVHDVMRCTMNYQYNVTQRFIDRIPEKPISCVKLREQYKKISAEVGCNCSFKRTKNCYPSPVLHALSLSGDVQENITIPTSRTLTAENEKKVIEEINVHKKAQELASRILDLRRQQRAIEKSVKKVERELEKIYDGVGTDALEIEMGLLVRRKKENGYEWVIEI